MVTTMLRTPMATVFVLFSLFLLNSKLSFAQGSEIESLRSLVKGMEQQLQKALQRIDQLEKEKTSTSKPSGVWIALPPSHFRRTAPWPSAPSPPTR